MENLFRKQNFYARFVHLQMKTIICQNVYYFVKFQSILTLCLTSQACRLYYYYKLNLRHYMVSKLHFFSISYQRFEPAVIYMGFRWYNLLPKLSIQPLAPRWIVWPCFKDVLLLVHGKANEFSMV